jgi:hypothetical protein
MVFLGYRAKRPWHPDPAWDPEGTTGVVEVCSAADCISEPPPDWEKRWDFNRAGCYTTAAEALATVPPAEATQFAVFSYWLLPVSGGPADPFNPSLPPLPTATGPADFELLGFDVVEIPVCVPGGPNYFPGFGHSPLSCNHLARKVRVNPSCLLDDRDEAIKMAERFNRTQPQDVEPGTYFVVKVARAPG